MTTRSQPVRVDADGAPVGLRTAGRGDPLVYVHDELSTEWNDFLDALSEHYTVTSIELPGFGVTPRPDHLETVEDLAFAVGDVLGDIGGGRPVALVGASIGGWVSLEATIRTAHLVDCLVLIGAPGLVVDGEVPGDYFVMTPDERSALLFDDPGADPKVDEDSWIRNTSMTARLVWQPRYRSPKLGHRLNRIRGSVAVVWGANDRLLTPRYGRALADATGATFVEIAGSGHFPVYEAPRPTADRVVEFLAAPVRAAQPVGVSE